MMPNYLYYSIVVLYENYLYELVISNGCYNIYLLLIYHKDDNKFYIHQHRRSIFFLYYHYPFFVWLKLVHLVFLYTSEYVCIKIIFLDKILQELHWPTF